MKSWIFFLLVILFSQVCKGQKNVIPANQISAFKLNLPEGSKQDKRFLSTAAASALLEAEIKDPKIKLSGVEVYILPSKTQSRFVEDSLLILLEKSGFQIEPLEDDNFAWVTKPGESYFVYLSTDSKESNIYLAKSNQVPQSPTRSKSSPAVTNTPGNPGLPSYIPPLPPARNTNKGTPLSQNTPVNHSAIGLLFGRPF